MWWAHRRHERTPEYMNSWPYLKPKGSAIGQSLSQSPHRQCYTHLSFFLTLRIYLFQAQRRLSVLKIRRPEKSTSQNNMKLPFGIICSWVQHKQNHSQYLITWIMTQKKSYCCVKLLSVTNIPEEFISKLVTIFFHFICSHRFSKNANLKTKEVPSYCIYLIACSCAFNYYNNIIIFRCVICSVFRLITAMHRENNYYK
jgi:hypothetical protein